MPERLAVCSWSLQPADLRDLIAQLKALGIHRVQLALDPLRETPALWTDAATLFHQHGIRPVSGMFGCVGEDYSTLESIRATGGIAPNATWEQNWVRIQEHAALAEALGLRLVTFHAGFLPATRSDPTFSILTARLKQVADLFGSRRIALGLETGQETAADLLDLLEQLERPGLGVNFDPANMILYGQGDPLAAARVLAPWIRQVHVKDARRSEVPGVWGREVPVGAGEVDWPALLQCMQAAGFDGDFCIEREAGDQRLADIRAARVFLEQLDT
jgi:L-ribulose-5-phosphate 3-epimerase